MIDDKSLEKLSTFIQQATEKNETCSIIVNIFKGGVSNIEKKQSFKMEDLMV